jgi:hypothetical protein
MSTVGISTPDIQKSTLPQRVTAARTAQTAGLPLPFAVLIALVGSAIGCAGARARRRN